MLDLDHPLTPYRFAASRQIDLIKECAAIITTAGDAQQRERMVKIASPAFAALRWLNSQQFNAKPQIAASIDRFENAISALARMQIRDTFNATDEQSRCPVCDGLLESPLPNARRYCLRCYDTIVKSLVALNRCFGTDAI